jgi:PAS domain-containing protein
LICLSTGWFRYDRVVSGGNRTQDEIRRLKARVAGLERERQIQAAIIEKAPVMISIARAPDFIYEVVTPASQALAPVKEFIGRRFADVWVEVSDPQILQNVMATGKPFMLEDAPYTIQQGPGGLPEVVYVTCSWIPLAGPDGKPDRILSSRPRDDGGSPATAGLSRKRGEAADAER